MVGPFYHGFFLPKRNPTVNTISINKIKVNIYPTSFISIPQLKFIVTYNLHWLIGPALFY